MSRRTQVQYFQDQFARRLVMPPALLKLPTAAQFKAHYETAYCSGPIMTHDGIPVYFSKKRFEHAFYESSQRNGVKDQFSIARAERMDWIKYALQQPTAVRYQGWISRKKKYDPTRQVTVVVNDFVVILRMKLDRKEGSLKAEFVTCYKADNSIGKIRTSPLWSEHLCRFELGK